LQERSDNRALTSTVPLCATPLVAPPRKGRLLSF
jgi:hypothetical protein